VNRTAPVIERETPFRMIRTTNVKDGRIDLSTCRYVDETTYERWTRRAKLLDGDVILTREAPIGEVGYIQKLGPVFLGQRLMQFRPDPEKVVPRYLYYAFRSPDLQHQFGTHDGSGSVVSHIRVADCHEFKVSVPPIDHQQNVATLLGSLDDKIELNRRMNETLEAMAQAIFRDWFVDFGPTRRKLEGADDPVTIMGGLVQDTERAQALADLFPAALGDDGLPEGWAERAFGAFVEIIGGGTPKTSNESYWNGPIPWFSVTDTPPKGSIFVDATEKTISEEGLANSSARLVRAGTTIISARGTVGNLALTPHEMTFNQSCYGLQGKGAVGDCFVFLAAQNIVERLKGMAHGSVFSTITRSTFDNVHLACVHDKIFEAFENLARPMFDKVLGNVKESRTLEATRDLLLPKLMSGEIRLSEADNLVEAAQ
jgi:type I restriction enzyme, S subunit